MIEKEQYICDICRNIIDKNNDVAYTDNGNNIVGNFCLCDFCYHILRKAW